MCVLLISLYAHITCFYFTAWLRLYTVNNVFFRICKREKICAVLQSASTVGQTTSIRTTSARPVLYLPVWNGLFVWPVVILVAAFFLKL